jgi:hypothetical protein
LKAGFGRPAGRAEGVAVDEQALVVHAALDGRVVVAEDDPAVPPLGRGHEGHNGLKMPPVFVVPHQHEAVLGCHDDRAAGRGADRQKE